MENRKRGKICTYIFFIIVLGTISIMTAANASADKVTICLAREPDVLDPTSSQDAVGGMTGIILRNIFDMLVGFDEDGNPEATIADWKLLDGGKCVEFKVREGIYFTSGDPLRAEDIEFSWMRSLEKVRQFKSFSRYFDHIDVIDDYTVRFYLTQPSVIFLLQNVHQMMVASKSYYKRVGEEEFVKNPVGTGPYKLTEWKFGEYVDLKKNEAYWGGNPEIDEARFVWCGEAATAAAMLKAGEIDFLWNASLESVPKLMEGGFKMVKTVGTSGAVLNFNMLDPKVPWSHLKVRQAINYAIDKDAIINKLFHGIPKKVGWLSPGELGYDPSLKPAYPYDVKKAKTFLAEAGYPDGFEMPLYKGTLWGSTVTDIVEYLTLALGEIGIKVDVITVEGPAIIQTFRKVHSDPASVKLTVVTGQTFTGSVDPITTLELLQSTNTMGLHHQPELDVLIAKGMAAMDDAERGSIIKKIFKILDDELPIIPILSNNPVVMVKPNMDYMHRSRIPGYVSLLDITIHKN